MRRMLTEEEILQIKQNAEDIDDIKETLEDMNIMENIVDEEGHNRFIEGEATEGTIEGLTFTYNKWSLSGSHLMLVIAGNITAGSEITAYTTLARYELPEWIMDKIYPAVADIVDLKIFAYRKTTDNQWWVKIEDEFILQKSGTYLNIKDITGLSTLAYDVTFRFQFDLLIDNEPSE